MILVTDFDNTFFTEDIKENVRLVNKFKENQDNLFIIATGRPLYLLEPELKKYNIKYDYLICNDGAVIFDSNNTIIDKTNIDYFTAIQIYNLLKRNINIKHVYIDNIINFGELESENFNGVLAMPFEHNDVSEIIFEINKKFHTVQCYLSHRWINILSVDASKGNAITFLQNLNNWNSSDIYLIGDNTNDLSMTKYENCYAVLHGKKEFIDKCNNQVKNFKELVEKITLK